ncbi:MAG: helix-turn-helix domain-containing protein [Candidatus Altiarchaeota archaeon]|nr:helix-turn-helix domain-containing protein [Candidatus Altiarchaeota archaeon]
MAESSECAAEVVDDDVLDIEGASQFLKCGISTLYHYVCNKKIPCIKLGTRTLFKRSDLLAWLDQYRQEPVQRIYSGSRRV